MVQIAIAVGSNCERERNISLGLDALQNVFGDLRLSCVYESIAEPNHEDHPPYYNLVATAKSTLAVVDIKTILRQIEDQCRRQRNSCNVTLDLDLLLYGNLVDCINGQALPHPDIERRAYVLRPLMELFPHAVHPVKGETYQRLWQQFPVSLNAIPVDFIWNGQVVSIAAPLVSL